MNEDDSKMQKRRGIRCGGNKDLKYLRVWNGSSRSWLENRTGLHIFIWTQTTSTNWISVPWSVFGRPPCIAILYISILQAVCALLSGK